MIRPWSVPCDETADWHAIAGWVDKLLVREEHWFIAPFNPIDGRSPWAQRLTDPAEVRGTDRRQEFRFAQRLEPGNRRSG